MNKAMKDLIGQMSAKLDEIKAADAEKAAALSGEYDALKTAYEKEKRVFEAEKEMAALKSESNPLPEVKADEPESTKSADEIVAAQVKALIMPNKYATKDLSDTVNSDGGYTVPVDAVTTINKYKEAYANLSSEITTERVTTRTGTRVFQKRGTPGAFAKLTSNGLGYTGSAGTDAESNKVANPEFEQLSYSIEDYAGFMPVPNRLINDSDAKIVNMVYEWLGKASADTDNSEILDLLGQSGTTGMGTGWTDLKDLDGIKKAVNVTLGQAFAPTAKIYTNDDGAQYLAELKEKTDSKKPLLTPVITDPAKSQLAVGFRAIPVVILPNDAMKSIAATSAAGGKIPMIIGDLKEAIVKFDRQTLAIDASTTATIGSSNAFAKNMTLFRGIMRADYKLRDSAAVVKGYISTPKASA